MLSPLLLPLVGVKPRTCTMRYTNADHFCWNCSGADFVCHRFETLCKPAELRAGWGYVEWQGIYMSMVCGGERKH